jgi:hypothetical protein
MCGIEQVASQRFIYWVLQVGVRERVEKLTWYTPTLRFDERQSPHPPA